MHFKPPVSRKPDQRRMLALVHGGGEAVMNAVMESFRVSWPEYAWQAEHRSTREVFRLLEKDARLPWSSVCMLPSNYRMLSTLVHKGCLTPLDAAFSARERTVFAPHALALSSVQGVLYGIPDDISPYVLVARRDVLARHNLAMPGTWMELERQLPRLAKACDGRPVRVETMPRSWDEGVGFLAGLLGSNGVSLESAEPATAQREPWREAYEFARRLQKTYGLYQPREFRGEASGHLEAFLNSSSAYCFAWPGRLARLPRDVLEKLDLGAFPRGPAVGPRTVLCKGSCWCVPRGTLAPDLAILLLKAFVAREPARQLECEWGCAFPAQSAFWRDPDVLRRKPVYAQASQILQAAQRVQPLPMNLDWNFAWTSFYESLQDDAPADAWLERVKTLCATLARTDIRNGRIRAALRLVETDLSGSGHVKTLAKRLGMHPRYFGALFKKETGMSFAEWLTRRRMERAREKLSDLACSTKELARSLGYRSSSVFCQVFKRHYGISATQMRRKLLEDAPSKS